MNRSRLMAIVLAVLLPTAVATQSAAATVELLSGSKLECKVLSKDATKITVEVPMGGKTVKRTIPLATVHKVTINEKEYLINEKPAAGLDKVKGKGKAKSSALDDDPQSSAGDALRTRAEIEKLINEQGRTPPDWFEATTLNHPQTLDLSWPEKPPGGWNNQKNIGQYVWDVINPNENKWREGVKLMHHLLAMHKDDPEKRTRAMHSLGTMYHNLHQDYARAAFWYRQAGVGKGSPFDRQASGAHLAECYWRLGNKGMAVEALNKLPATFATIKLWGDLGETEKCVKLATQAIPSARWPAECHLLIGDAYRVAGQSDKALAAYQKALDEASKPDHAREEKLRVRASASVDALRLSKGLDLAKIADGDYASESLGYEGPIHVAVMVKAHRIEGVRITQHKEKQYYSALSDTPRKIVARQGVQGVDATSGATITSEAIINATAKALASGAK